MSRVWKLLAVLTLLPATAAPEVGYPGRFAPLRNISGPDLAEAANTTYSLVVEKVFKLLALVPARDGAWFGRRAYAGSLALVTPDGAWSYALPATARTTRVTWPEPQTAHVTQTVSQGEWRATMTAEVAVEYPAVWFGLQREAGAAPLRAGLIGYGWAQRSAPVDWVANGQVARRPAGRRLAVPLPASGELVLSASDPQGFTTVLRFAPAPVGLDVDDDGLAWHYAAAVSSARVTCLLLPGRPDAATVATLLAGLARPPRDLRQQFGSGPDGPWVELSADADWLALPPPLAGAATDGVALATVQGPVRLVPGRRRRFPLAVPPGLDAGPPPFRPLSPAAAATVEQHVAALLARQQPDGSFSFSQGRSFHDSMTVAVLAMAEPLLSPALRARVAAAVTRGVQHFWADQQLCPRWPGVMLPPEQPGYNTSAVDYPEILGCVLQATALAAERHDPAYGREHWPAIDRQMAQLRRFMDPNGVALACPGPAYWHVIAESALGGYVAWQALGRLARQAGQPAAADEARARAAYAWQAWRTLFCWRPEFGATAAVVNGIQRGLVETVGTPAWTYVQSTYFAPYACVVLPTDDALGLWRSLDAQPWYEWTGKLGSPQRIYDGANVCALARAGRLSGVNEHWPAIAQRPFKWTWFDETPVLEVAAWCWLTAAR